MGDVEELVVQHSLPSLLDVGQCWATYACPCGDLALGQPGGSAHRGEPYAEIKVDRLDLVSALVVIRTNIIVQVDCLGNTCVSVSALSLE